MGSLLAAAIFAQQPKAGPSIGVLGNTAGHPNYEVFPRALRELGYVEGRNIAFEWRWGEGGAERSADLANELVRSIE